MSMLMPHRIRRLHWQARAPTAPSAFALRGLLREATDEVLAALENSLSAHIPADRVVRLPRLALRLQLPSGADHNDLVRAIEHAVAEALAGLDIAAPSQAAAPETSQPPARPSGPADLDVLRSLPYAEQQRLLEQALDGLQADDDSTLVSLPLPGGAARLPLGLLRQIARQLRDADASAPAPPGSSPAHHAQASLNSYLASGYVDWTLAGLDPETLLQILREAALAWVEGDALPPAIARLRPALRPGAVARWLALLPTNRRGDALATRRDAEGALARHPLTSLLRQRALADNPASSPPTPPWVALWLAWRLAANDAPDSLAEICRDLQPLLPSITDADAQALRAALGAEPPHGLPPGAAQPAEPAPPPRISHRPDIPTYSQRPLETAPTGMLVPAAGLVLAHPYLPRLLDATGLYPAGTRGPLPDPALPAAASLLHWLATGREAEQEFSLPFIKLLLGRTPDTPLPHAPTPLPEAWRDEADALLDAMLSHWQALRGTRPAGLRSGFLQRRGCLEQRDSAWHLRIEPESFDMLLDLLPWGFSLVRLPWMPRPLVTEWPTP